REETRAAVPHAPRPRTQTRRASRRADDADELPARSHRQGAVHARRFPRRRNRQTNPPGNRNPPRREILTPCARADSITFSLRFIPEPSAIFPPRPHCAIMNFARALFRPPTLSLHENAPFSFPRTRAGFAPLGRLHQRQSRPRETVGARDARRLHDESG